MQQAMVPQVAAPVATVVEVPVVEETNILHKIQSLELL
jgi:hypothetical protein